MTSPFKVPTFIKKCVWRLVKSSIEIRWRRNPIENAPEIEVLLGGTCLLLLKATYNYDKDRYEYTEFRF